MVPFSRDHARTPFQWSAENNAGFTAGTPWLKVNPNYTRVNLAEQRGREDSVYNFYRRLIALRKDPLFAETIVYGRTEPWQREKENFLSYFRRGDRSILVAANFSGEAMDVSLPDGSFEVLLNNLPELHADGKTACHLLPWQFLILDYGPMEGVMKA